MMVLTSAVVVLGILCVLNLAVSAALIRRLRDLPGRDTPPAPGGLPAGSAVPEFALRSENGDPLDLASLRGRHTLIAFLSTTCPACAVQAPGFAAIGSELADAGTDVITVLLSNGPDTRGLRALLSSADTLLTDADALALTQVFRIEATPTYCLIGPDATVTASFADLADLPRALPLPAN